ncbi:hypothetical protein PoB_007551000 [Plakobranchus ocellatus]|uniref:Uncharacterized protein n=1 Tax=Plakobranchus ocellatus TaxID=259542 RepID=A0AAV4DY70_9GAST|nr:hypothetical protein PoB_007551000 [Plakobranchus ocellatus]
MAARTISNSTQRKEQYLDWLELKFNENTKAYVSAVKSTIRSEDKEMAAEVFESALEFLSRDFPDPICPTSDTPSGADDKSELTSLRERISILEAQLQDALDSVKQEAQSDRSSLESKIESTFDLMKTNVRRLNGKFSGLKNNLNEIRSDTETRLEELSKDVKVHGNNIQGLRKLQKLLQQNNQSPQAAVGAKSFPATGAVAAATTDTDKPKPLKDFRLRAHFSVKVAADKFSPDIEDTKLLPGGLLLLCDFSNDRLKLFNTQGLHIHSLECPSAPRRLAVVDISSISGVYAVAVTLIRDVHICQVTADRIKSKKILQMPGECWAVTATDSQTLAVGYMYKERRIDLISLNGQVLRQIFPDITPRFMISTSDSDLVCSTLDKTLARVKLDTAKTSNVQGHYAALQSSTILRYKIFITSTRVVVSVAAALHSASAIPQTFLDG